MEPIRLTQFARLTKGKFMSGSCTIRASWKPAVFSLMAGCLARTAAIPSAGRVGGHQSSIAIRDSFTLQNVEPDVKYRSLTPFSVTHLSTGPCSFSP